MNYAKAILAVVATVVSGIVVALTGDGIISNVEWINVAIGGAGACAVFAAPNVRGAMYTKSILAALTAALTLLVSFISDGVSTSEWLQIGIAVMGALGVYAVPNSISEKMSANRRAGVAGLLLAALLLPGTLLLTACPKKESVVFWGEQANGLATDLLPILASNGAPTANAKRFIGYTSSAVAAIKNDDGTALGHVSAAISLFESVATDAQIIHDPTKRTLALAFLGLINRYLHNLAAKLPPDGPGLTGRAADSKAIREFAKKKVWRCRDSATGRYTKMEQCKAHPETTTVETR